MHRRISHLSVGVCLLIGLAGVGNARGQSICSGLGAAGPEICVLIQQFEPDPADPNAMIPTYSLPLLREPAGPAAPPLIITDPIGDFLLGLAVVSGFGPGGMFININGFVTRTGMTAGARSRLSVIVQGGRVTPFGDADGDLNLVGDATGPSRIWVGGGAGYHYPGDPLEVDWGGGGFPQTIDEQIYGPGQEAFFTEILDQPLGRADAVAIHLSVDFQITAGGTVNVPAGVGIVPRTNPRTSPPGEPHFQCYSVEEQTGQEQRAARLQDQFAAVEAFLGDITRICAPVSKNDEEMSDPDIHLVCYEIIDGHYAERRVETKNQFGNPRVTVDQAKELCVPSLKELVPERETDGEPPPPP